MIVAIITDCYDENSKGRQITRAGVLFKAPVSFVAVSSELEASGNLVDNLDAIKGEKGLILVNVSRRDGDAKKWQNGPPFAYFWYKKTLVISSISGLTLSLIKKLNIAKTINVVDIPTVIDILIDKQYISAELKEETINTQFRSFNFLPYLAKFLFEYKNIKSESLDINDLPDAPFAIWYIDNFGNCKITLLENEIIKEKDKIVTKIGKFPYYSKLKDVPNDEAAIIIGSSGIGNNRFLEIVIQGDSASNCFNLYSGDTI